MHSIQIVERKQLILLQMTIYYISVKIINLISRITWRPEIQLGTGPSGNSFAMTESVPQPRCLTADGRGDARSQISVHDSQ